MTTQNYKSIDKIIFFFIKKIGFKKTAFLSALLTLVTILEVVGVGLFIPLISLFLDDSFFENYSIFNNLFLFTGNLSQINFIYLFLGLILTTYFIKLLIVASVAWYKNLIIFDLTNNLQKELFMIYINYPYEEYIQKNTSLLIRNIIDSVENVCGNVILPLIVLVAELLVLISIISFLLIYEPYGTILMILVISIGALIVHKLTSKKISLWGNSRNKFAGLRIKSLMQGLKSLKELKILGKQENFLNDFSYYNLLTVKSQQKQTTVLEIPRLWLEFLVIFCLVVLIFSMLQTNQTLSLIVPKLGIFAIAAMRLLPSANRIVHSLQCIIFGRPAANIILREIEENQHISYERNPEILKIHDSIIIDNLSYKYPKKQKKDQEIEIISNINLEIKKNSLIGIVGESGSGKSTLADLILGLLKPSKGDILIDKNNIQLNLDKWQNNIGYVPQNIYLSDDTIKKNIAFGIEEEDIDQDRLEKSIKIAQLENFIDILPGKINTSVGENGIGLSGGQCQRIGIARAFYRNPEVIILDEATSALDIETEKKIMDIVLNLKDNKTIIVISHRITDKSKYDNIYKLNNGVLSLI